MPTTTLQAQLHQLQKQLKLSQSPKQSKMLQNAIARLEEKLKEEAAEQARLQAEAEAKAKAEKEAQEQEAIAKAEQDQKAIAKQSDSPAKSGKKKRGPRPPKTEQALKDGRILLAVPGQGHHVFCWKVWAEIQSDADGKLLLQLEDMEEPIPIPRVSKQARNSLATVELPVQRFCSIYPVVKDGKLESLRLQYCTKTEKQAEIFFTRGYWIAEQETLQIQTDFWYQRMRSRNFFHQIPVKEGITPPKTGFRALQLERDRLNIWVTGELPREEEG